MIYQDLIKELKQVRTQDDISLDTIHHLLVHATNSVICLPELSELEDVEALQAVKVLMTNFLDQLIEAAQNDNLHD